jgi:hypothetical protein
MYMGNQDIMNFEWESFHAFSICVRLENNWSGLHDGDNGALTLLFQFKIET